MFICTEYYEGPWNQFDALAVEKLPFYMDVQCLNTCLRNHYRGYYYYYYYYYILFNLMDDESLILSRIPSPHLKYYIYIFHILYLYERPPLNRTQHCEFLSSIALRLLAHTVC